MPNLLSRSRRSSSSLASLQPHEAAREGVAIFALLVVAVVVSVVIVGVAGALILGAELSLPPLAKLLLVPKAFQGPSGTSPTSTKRQSQVWPLENPR